MQRQLYVTLQWGTSNSLVLTKEVVHHLWRVVRGGGNPKELLSPGHRGVIDCLDIDVMSAHEFITDFRVFSSICNPDRDDVTGAVDDWEAGVHQHLPHELDIALVLAAKRPALGALQDPHRLQGSGQQHGRQGGGEDEASRIGPYSVDQGTRAGNVPSNTAKGFAWEETASFITATAPKCAQQGAAEPQSTYFSLHCPNLP